VARRLTDRQVAVLAAVEPLGNLGEPPPGSDFPVSPEEVVRFTPRRRGRA
jgi:hypothetical protein